MRPSRVMVSGTAGFTLVEILVASALLVAALLPWVGSSARVQTLFEASSREAGDQHECQRVMEHLTRTLRFALRFEALIPGESVDVRYRRDDGGLAWGRYVFVPADPIAERPAEVLFLPDRDAPGSRLSLGRGVSVTLETSLAHPRLLDVHVEAERNLSGAPMPRTAKPFQLTSRVWMRAPLLLLTVLPPRVEAGS